MERLHVLHCCYELGDAGGNRRPRRKGATNVIVQAMAAAIAFSTTPRLAGAQKCGPKLRFGLASSSSTRWACGFLCASVT